MLSFHFVNCSLHSAKAFEVDIIPFAYLQFCCPCPGGQKKCINKALAGVSQWIECQPANQKVSSSIHSQGACLGCGPGPQ